MLAFLIGSATILPALSYFCITTGVCIFFILVFQIMLFVPLLAIDETRRARGLNDLCCCWSTCCCESCMCSGGPVIEQSAEAEAGTEAGNMSIESADSPASQQRGSRVHQHSHSIQSGTEGGSGIGVAKTETLDQTNSEEPTKEQPQKNCCGVRTGFIRYLLRQLSGPMIDSTIGNVVVVLLFLGILTMGIVGCVFQTDDLNLERFFPTGESNLFDRQFRFVGLVQAPMHGTGLIPIPTTLTWLAVQLAHTPVTQATGRYSEYGACVGTEIDLFSCWQLNAEMDSLMYSTMNNSWIVSSTVSSWNHNFQQWTTANSLTYSTEQDWYSGLNQFLASVSGRQFRRNLIFNNNSLSGSTSNPLIIARISCNHIKKTGSGSEVQSSLVICLQCVA